MVSAVNNVATDQAWTGAAARGGALVGVMSVKGGCGASTLAINLSAALARSSGSTVLVDANLQNPDVALMLGKTGQFGLLDLIDGASEPTPEALDACTVSLGQSLFPWSLLSPPLTGEASLRMQLTDICKCVVKARAAADFWVLDMPNHLDRHLVTLLDACDAIILVLEETTPAISAARRWWNIFHQLGYPPTKLFFVINREGSRTMGGQSGISHLLPVQYFKVPNCFSLCDESVIASSPPVISFPRHKFSQAMNNLAAALIKHLQGADYE